MPQPKVMGAKEKMQTLHLELPSWCVAIRGISANELLISVNSTGEVRPRMIARPVPTCHAHTAKTP